MGTDCNLFTLDSQWENMRMLKLEIRCHLVCTQQISKVLLLDSSYLLSDRFWRSSSPCLCAVLDSQVRGEAKSGTSFMYEWAVNALVVTCSWLELLFGRGACRISWKNIKGEAFPTVPKEATVKEIKTVLLEFEPRTQRDGGSSGDAACKCEDVDK